MPFKDPERMKQYQIDRYYEIKKDDERYKKWRANNQTYWERYKLKHNIGNRKKKQIKVPKINKLDLIALQDPKILKGRNNGNILEQKSKITKRNRISEIRPKDGKQINARILQIWGAKQVSIIHDKNGKRI